MGLISRYRTHARLGCNAHTVALVPDNAALSAQQLTDHNQQLHVDARETACSCVRMSDALSHLQGSLLCHGRYRVVSEINSECRQEGVMYEHQSCDKRCKCKNDLLQEEARQWFTADWIDCSSVT